MLDLTPIGVVRTQQPTVDSPHPFYTPAQLVLEPQYEPALHNLTLNSHIWVICLFEHRRKPKMEIQPTQIHPQIERFGVLALRAPNHPNPIALTLAKLVKVEGATVYVENLDAFDGTPVLDIKPYFDRDIIFSPRLPDIRHHDPARRQSHLLTMALNHHQEACPGLALAVRMISLLEQRYQVNPLNPQLTLQVAGDACLADSLQGLCRARLAHPARFAFQMAEHTEVHFQAPEQSCLMRVLPSSWRREFGHLLSTPAAEIIELLPM